MSEKLGPFTQAYHTAIEQQIESFGRGKLPHYGAPTTVVRICKAADGYVTFYCVAPSGLPIAPEILVVVGTDFSEYTLDTICQATTLSMLKVASPRLGQPVEVLPVLRPDLPREDRPPDLQGNTFSTDTRAAAQDGTLLGMHLPAMAVCPRVQVTAGIQTAILPGRVKIWSPTVDLPDRGRVRLYQWTHADFWWMPDDLPLESVNAAEQARLDFLSLQAVLAAKETLTTATAGTDIGMHAADLLDTQCNEFLVLLDEKGGDEEELHRWLFRPDHHLFLDPHAVEVWSKVPFGSKESDFVIRRADGTYTLMEIEHANLRIFTQKGQEPTAEFNHACQQVRDWRRYIRDNVNTVRVEQNMPGIYEPAGAVVMGRSRDIEGSDATTRWRDMKTTHEFALATYDEMCEHVRAIARQLRAAVPAS
jgi:hypothetical protein